MKSINTQNTYLRKPSDGGIYEEWASKREFFSSTTPVEWLRLNIQAQHYSWPHKVSQYFFKLVQDPKKMYKRKGSVIYTKSTQTTVTVLRKQCGSEIFYKKFDFI